MKKRFYFVIPVLVTLIIYLSGCGNSGNKFLKAVDKGNYSDAQEIYAIDIAGNGELELEAYNGLAERVILATGRYNDGSDTFTEAAGLLITIQKCGIIEEQLVANALTQLKSLQFSKTSFDTAEKLFKKEDYKNAIQYYADVISDDSNFEKAQKHSSEAQDAFRKGVLKQAAEYADSSDYNAALNILRSALMTIKDDPEITNQISLYGTKNDANEVKQILDEANGLMKNSQYSEAYILLDKANKERPADISITSALSGCRKDYITYAINSAAGCFKNGSDYEGAIKILNLASGNITDSEELKKELDKYMIYRPILIGELESYYEEGLFYTEDSIQDNLGASYDNAFYAYVDSSITYKINGKYDNISGKVIISYDNRSNEDCGWIKIYGDGKLLFNSGTMGAGKEPVDFKLDIGDVAELTVESESVLSQCYLVNTYLTKNIP